MIKIRHVGDYASRRRAAYPPIGDQLDALLKAFKQNSIVSEELEQVVLAVERVKNQFPKPDEDSAV